MWNYKSNIRTTYDKANYFVLNVFNCIILFLQAFDEDSSAAIFVIFLFLRFSGFVLLLLLLSMLFLTLTHAYQPELMDTECEEEDVEEGGCGADGDIREQVAYFETQRNIKQCEKQTNCLLLKVIKVKTRFLTVLHQLFISHWQHIYIMHSRN